MKTQNEKKKCVVCGARCRDFNSDTCDSTCTRAKHNGLTRARQIRTEMDAANREARSMAEWEEASETQHRRSMEDLHYNRPYLFAAA